MTDHSDSARRYTGPMTVAGIMNWILDQQQQDIIDRVLAYEMIMERLGCTEAQIKEVRDKLTNSMHQLYKEYYTKIGDNLTDLISGESSRHIKH